MAEQNSNEIIQETDHIAIKCAADNRTAKLEEAVLADWKQCSECSLFICKSCIDEFNKTSGACPGSILGNLHEMSLELIPVKDLILMAKKHTIPSMPATGLLIYRAFFNQALKIGASGSTGQNSMNNPFLNSAFFVKQEKWVTGSVLVKRDHGKFITWERLTEY